MGQFMPPASAACGYERNDSEGGGHDGLHMKKRGLFECGHDNEAAPHSQQAGEKASYNSRPCQRLGTMSVPDKTPAENFVEGPMIIGYVRTSDRTTPSLPAVVFS